MNWLTQFFISIALFVQTFIGGFFPSQQSPPQTPSVQQMTASQPAPLNVASATASPVDGYTMADLESFRLSGAAKQCTQPSPDGSQQIKYYVGDHKFFMNNEVSERSSSADVYIPTQEYLIRDGTTAYSWTINPNTNKIDVVYKYQDSTSLSDTTDDTNDITCSDWTPDPSLFALPAGVKIDLFPVAGQSDPTTLKITDLPVAQQPSAPEQDLVRGAQQTLNPNDPLLKAVLLFVQKIQASKRTDIPDLRAFVSTWGPAIDSWNSLDQELKGVSVDSLNAADLDALSARVEKVQSDQIKILAAYEALSKDEISLLDTAPTDSQ